MFKILGFVLFISAGFSWAGLEVVARDPSEPDPIRGPVEPVLETVKPLQDFENRNRPSPRNYPGPTVHNFIEYALGDNKKYLFQPSCKQAEVYAKDLEEWMKSRGEKCSYKKPKPQDLFKNYEGWCYTDVTQCLPSEIISFYGNHNNFAGPNCFNSALMVAHVVPSLRYVSDLEFEATLNSPLCKPVQGAARPGDIGAIVSKDLVTGNLEYSHGYIHVSDRISYSKNGNSERSPYILTPTNSMNEVYQLGKNKSCPNDADKDPPSGRKCDNYSSFFRCESFDEYIGKQNLPKGLNSVLDSIVNSEGCVDSFSRGNSSVFSVVAQENVIGSIKALSVYLDQHANELSPKEVALVNIFKQRVFSIYEHFSMYGNKQFGGGVVHSEEQSVFLSGMKEELKKLDPAVFDK